MLGNRERGEDATLATDVESLEEQQDEASLLPTASLPNRFDFHIVYHVSYRVPVLYFNGYDAGWSVTPWVCSPLRISIECMYYDLLYRSHSMEALPTLLPQQG